MQITEQEFFDYLKCPAYYHMKYLSKVNLDEQATMPQLLNKVAKYFYFKVLDNKVPSLNELKGKWDSLCVKHPDVVTRQKSIEGLGLIQKMTQWAQQEKIIILDAEARYSFHVGDHEFVGSLSTIMPHEKKQGRYEVLLTDFSNRAPDPNIINMKLKYTLEHYGFFCAYDQMPERVRIRNIKNAKDFYTGRSEEDYKRLRTAIKSVGDSIDQKLFYPRELTCGGCSAKEYCKHWSLD